MSGQCNRKTLKGHLQDIITFIIIKCRQMKILKKKLSDLEFLTHKEQKTQKQPLSVLQIWPFDKKCLLKCSSSGNLIEILDKYI